MLFHFRMCDVKNVTLDTKSFGFPFDRETDIKNIYTLRYAYFIVADYRKFQSCYNTHVMDYRSVSSQKIKILFNSNNETERLRKIIEPGKPHAHECNIVIYLKQLNLRNNCNYNCTYNNYNSTNQTSTKLSSSQYGAIYQCHTSVEGSQKLARVCWALQERTCKRCLMIIGMESTILGGLTIVKNNKHC